MPRYPRRRGRRVTERVGELVGHARRELAYGAARTQLWLRRRHDVRIAMETIQRIFRDLGVPRLRKTRKRKPRQMTLFEKAEPGESVQVDVKFVKIGGRWVYQYTAIDDCTRFRVLRLYRHLHQSVSLAFLAEIRRAMPFPIRKTAMRQRTRVRARVRVRRRSGRDPAPLRPPAEAAARTARSNAATASTGKSFGAGRSSPISTRRQQGSANGSARTTTIGSRWPFGAIHQRRSSPLCCPPRSPEKNQERASDFTVAGQRSILTRPNNRLDPALTR